MKVNVILADPGDSASFLPTFCYIAERTAAIRRTACGSTDHFLIMAIEHEVSAADAAAIRLTQSIGLFREYRTRPIADVVTGQLDVREAAARLPVEDEEPESVEEIDKGAGDDEDMLDEGLESAEVEGE